MKIALLVLLAVAACGGESPPSNPDGGPIARGVRGTGPADAGGVWLLGSPCTAQNAAVCPFPEVSGTCYVSSLAPGRPFCGVPNDCPTGSGQATSVNIGLCMKLCAGAPDCAPTTYCYSGYCVPF